MNDPKRVMVWSGKERPTTNPDLQEAARQREQIRQQMMQEEQERAERAKLAELLKKYGKV